MVDRYVVQARIAKIREYVTLLRKVRQSADERHFVKDPLIYGNAERYLQLAIQAVLDISNHIVADMKLNRNCLAGWLEEPANQLLAKELCSVTMNR